MEPRQKNGIYEFLKKSGYPKKKKHQRECLDLLHSHYHYFVVTRVGESDCEGFMITHGTTEEYPANLALKPEHFVEGPGLLSYDNSFFLTIPLIKVNTLDTRQVGLFTDQGVKHLIDNAKNPSRTWSEYVEDYCKNK